MTQATLATATAEELPRGLTAAAVSQFEVGDAIPSVPILRALVVALSIDAGFLTLDAGDDEAHLPAFFRSLRATPAVERRRARNVIQLVHRLAVILDREVGLPARDVPSVPADPFDEPDERRAAAEAAAAAVRKAWKMERGPVGHVINTLESHGVICARLQLSEARVDAFSVNFADHPVAVLATDKDKWDRSRFDAAHELGHLVMHHEAAGLPEAERQANEFAAAFLMPTRDVLNHLPARPDWRMLRDLKLTWGVSMAALLMRARTLGVMPESTYVSATKVMSARGWRRHEPVHGDPETPSILKAALAAAKRRGLAPEDLRREAAIPSDIFLEVCQLIAG